MAFVGWDPARELASMEVDRLNRMFSNGWRDEDVTRAWTPPVDIYTTSTHDVVVKVDLPEMKREDISITVEGNVLTLKGERKFEGEAARENYQRLERRYGTFNRSFTLPAGIDASRIRASYKDGVLTLRLPQREEARPKQIAISD